jgi:Putative prokaryotic signal transducing protein
MHKVFTAAHPTEAHLVKGLLESEGIEAVVRGEALFGARGEAPVTVDTLPSVWVIDPADADRAAALIAVPAADASGGVPGDRTWRCPACNESIGQEFSACWKCGASGTEL